MTITRTITKKETQEIEITFPVYKKLSTGYYKVISEKESIQILPSINCISVCDYPTNWMKYYLREQILQRMNSMKSLLRYSIR
jgi:hypothetical protein